MILVYRYVVEGFVDLKHDVKPEDMLAATNGFTEGVRESLAENKTLTQVCSDIEVKAYDPNPELLKEIEEEFKERASQDVIQHFTTRKKS